MTKYQVLRQIAEYRIACKQDGVSIEDRPSSHRLIQGWNAIWILINRIKNGYYDQNDEDYDDDQNENEDAPALYNKKACEEVYQDLTKSLGDLLDE